MSAPPAIKGALSVWGAPPAGIELMRKIKTEFDPHNLLNAGRFVI
jgi:glycolate oxidase FAD binding subunit